MRAYDTAMGGSLNVGKVDLADKEEKSSKEDGKKKKGLFDKIKDTF